MGAKTKTFWFIILAFLLGGIGGGFVGKSYLGRGHADGKRANREEVRKRFSDKLQLTPEQAAVVDSIIEVHRSKIDTVSRQYSDIFKAHRDTLRNEIHKLLTPEQNERYNEFLKKIERREQNRSPGPM